MTIFYNGLKALFPDYRTEIRYRSVWKNIIILLQISGRGGIDLSVGKRRFTEERNLTKENKKRKAGVINTLKNITLLSDK